MTTIEVRAIAEYEFDTWDSFVDSSASGTLYHTSIWRRALNHSYGDGEYTIVAAWNEGEIVAGFCALTRMRLGVCTAVTPLATPYTGFLFSPATAPEIKSSLISYLRVFRYQHLQCAPGIGDLVELTNAGYQLIPRRTLEINLRMPEEELWESLDSNVRRNIRKAQKFGYDITDQWDENECFKILCDTFERNNTECPIENRWFQEVANGHILSDYRRRYVAWKEDKPHAFLIALRHKGKVYYQLAGTASSARNSGISSFLIWEMLREHLDGNWDIFDFVGGNTASISRFKEGFNPSVRPHFSVELNRSRRITIGRAMRDFIRRK